MFGTALARRFYLHVKHGGSLSEQDLSHIVKSMEDKDRYITELTAEVEELRRWKKKVLIERLKGALDECSEDPMLMSELRPEFEKIRDQLTVNQNKLDRVAELNFPTTCPLCGAELKYDESGFFLTEYHDCKGGRCKCYVADPKKCPLHGEGGNDRIPYSRTNNG